MGVYTSVFNENLFPCGSYRSEDVPDMSGKVALITGGTAGIGKETARVLLLKNARVWITARSKSKGDATLQELKELTGKDAHLVVLDLGNLKSIKAGAEDFNSEKQLDVLFNNAGVMIPPIGLLTDDGYDLQFGTNALGHFYFTKLVLPTLLATAKAAPDGFARVINTSSNAHWMGNINLDTVRDCPARTAAGTWGMYGQSKSANIVFTAELVRRYGDQGIISASLNPGGIKTELQRHARGIRRKVMESVLFDVKMGAINQLYAGTTPDAKSVNNKYLIPWARIGKAREDTQDPELGRRLWEYFEEQVKDV